MSHFESEVGPHLGKDALYISRKERYDLWEEKK